MTVQSARAAPRRSHGLRWLLIGAALAAVAAGIAASRPWAAPPQPVPASSAVQAPAITARGRVVPVRQARVAPWVSGIVDQLLVEEGQSVRAQQQIMRLDAGDATIVLTAPWSGVVARIEYRVGDTVVAGQTAILIGDLTRLQVETTDLDEFSVSRIRVGQPVSVWFDALDAPPVRGVVSRIAIAGQIRATGEVVYPTVVEFVPGDKAPRWGMTTRLEFED